MGLVSVILLVVFVIVSLHHPMDSNAPRAHDPDPGDGTAGPGSRDVVIGVRPREEGTVPCGDSPRRGV